jgi:hypothetical protein
MNSLKDDSIKYFVYGVWFEIWDPISDFRFPNTKHPLQTTHKKFDVLTIYETTSYK